MGNATPDWEDELERWLKPFLGRLGHKARRRMCPLYIAGLIGPGERKSIQPIAERLAAGDYDQLHHFIADGVWDATPLQTELLARPTGLSAATMPCLLSMTPRCRRRATARSVSGLNMHRLLARRQIAKHWCR